MAKTGPLQARRWLVTMVSATLLLSLLTLPVDAGKGAKHRQRRFVETVFQRLLDAFRSLLGVTSAPVDSQGCPPVETPFGRCNNSWADLTPEEMSAEEIALQQRRLTYNISYDPVFRQPIREILPDASQQFLLDLRIDPEWSSVYPAMVQFITGIERSYLDQDLPFPNIDTFQEYANITDFFQRTYTERPPIPSLYRPWSLDPPNDPNFTESNRWADDKLFANSRVAGINAINIYRVGSRGLPLSTANSLMNRRDFDWDAAIQLVSGYNFRQAVLRRRLFAQYHPLLPFVTNDINGRNPFAGQRFLTPFVLFVLPPGEKLFRVVAVQLGSNSSSPVYSPTTSTFFWWTYAKAMANTANVLHAELVLHLHDAHLTGARFALPTQRELAPDHAVRRLMDYHLRGLHQTNTFAFSTLLHPLGTFSFLAMPGHRGNAEFVARAFESWNYRRMNPHREAAYRGVQHLPHYPYYEDGKKLFLVLRRYVSGYVRLYYCCDDQVRNDAAVQRWVRSAAIDIHDGTKGVPEQLDTIVELVDYLTNQVWLYTGYHAAVNYPYGEYMYHPVGNTQLQLRPDQVNQTLADATSLDNLDYFIQKFGNINDVTGLSTIIMSLVGMKFTPIVDPSPAFQTGRTAQLASFVETEFAALEQSIRQENARRQGDGLLPYKYLLPSELIGSISI